MPARKGVAKSSAHKSKIRKSVKKYNSGDTKTRDGVESNNKYDSKKRLRTTTQGSSGPKTVKEQQLTNKRNPMTSGVGQYPHSSGANPKKPRSNKERVKEIESGRDAKFSPVSRKDYGKSQKRQASNSKVFGGRPGAGPQGKKGIIMNQSEGATESQAKQYGGLAQSDQKVLAGSGSGSSSAQRLGYGGPKKDHTKIKGERRSRKRVRGGKKSKG